MIGEETCHPATRAMLAYGRALARQNEPPRLLGADGAADRLLVLETARGGAVVSAFAEGLVSLFGRDLKGQDFCALFTDPDRALFEALLQATSAAGEPGVARAVAETGGAGRIGLELLVTPLRTVAAGRAGIGRHLAMLQPLGGERFLEGAPILRLRLGALLTPFSRAEPNLRLVVSND